MAKARRLGTKKEEREMSEAKLRHHLGLLTVGISKQYSMVFERAHAVWCLSQTVMIIKNGECYLVGLYEPLRHLEDISFHWKDSWYLSFQWSNMRVMISWYGDISFASRDRVVPCMWVQYCLPALSEILDSLRLQYINTKTENFY